MSDGQFARAARWGSRFAAVAAALLVVGLGAESCKKSSTDGSTSTTKGLCEPGENIFCRCPGGAAGTKTCKADGQSFEACIGRDGTCAPPSTTICEAGESIYCSCANGTDGQKSCTADGMGFGTCNGADGPCETGGGTGGAGGGTSTGGAGTGGAPPKAQYLEPCAHDADCAEGKCPMGFCTKDCAKPEECKVDDKWVADCIAFKGLQVCMPICLGATDCQAYGYPSDCGYTHSVDGVPDTVCADWQDALELPPNGSTCASDLDCDLGHDEKQRICIFQKCGEGCHGDADCPKGQACSGTGGNPGTCN
jgi:hypothetical protein